MDRRVAEDDRRLGERVASLEAKEEAQDRTLDVLAPVAVHIAEMGVKYEAIHENVVEIKESLDDLSPRLRKLEYAVLLLSAAAISPKIGGPAVPDVVSAVLSYLS